MLKFFRNQKNQKRIYVTLALIIIPSFIITGVVLFAPQGDGVEGTSALGTINGHKVTIGQYLTSYKATMRQAQMIYGEKYTQAKQFLNIKGEAWDRLLLLEYAKKNRIRTSDAEVVDWLQSQSAFQRGGQFDLRLYKMYVDQVMRANTKEFESEVRDMLTLEKVRQGVMKNAVLTDAELRKLFAAETGSREIVYGVLPWKTQKDASVTDAEVDQLYPLVKDRLTAPPRVKIRYLFVPKEEEVSKAAAIADTASIAELSAKYGLEARETALFSTNDAVPEFGPAPELLQKSFELDKGQESAWIRSAKGAYKLASLEKEAERPLSVDEARGTLKELALRSKASQLAVKKLKELKPKIDAEGFEKTLTAAGIETKSAKFGKDDPIEALGAGADRALKGLKQGQVSEAFLTEDGAAIAKIVKDAEFDAARFDREKETFRKEALAEKASDTLKALLGELRKDLKIDAQVMRKIFGPESAAAA